MKNLTQELKDSSLLKWEMFLEDVMGCCKKRYSLRGACGFCEAAGRHNCDNGCTLSRRWRGITVCDGHLEKAEAAALNSDYGKATYHGEIVYNAIAATEIDPDA